MSFWYHEFFMNKKAHVREREEIFSRLRDELLGILMGRPVMMAYLFGSAADETGLWRRDCRVVRPDQVEGMSILFQGV